MAGWSAVSVLDDGWVDAAVDEVGTALRAAVLEVVHGRLDSGELTPADAREVVLAAVGALAELGRMADREQVLLLAEARTRGSSWDHCGAAVGVSRQALHRKYADATGGVQQVAEGPGTSATADLLAGMVAALSSAVHAAPERARVGAVSG